MNKVASVLFLGLALGAGSAQAFTTYFLKDTPVSHFTNEDVDILIATAKRALNELPDGDSVEWSNPKTSSSGILTPLNTTEGVNGKCRVLKHSSSYKTLTSSGQTTLCLQKDGSWKAPVSRKK